MIDNIRKYGYIKFINEEYMRKYDNLNQIRITLYPRIEEVKLIDEFFLQNRKWKKGGFFLEAVLEKMERELCLKEAQEKMRNTNGITDN